MSAISALHWSLRFIQLTWSVSCCLLGPWHLHVCFSNTGFKREVFLDRDESSWDQWYHVCSKDNHKFLATSPIKRLNLTVLLFIHVALKYLLDQQNAAGEMSGCQDQVIIIGTLQPPCEMLGMLAFEALSSQIRNQATMLEKHCGEALRLHGGSEWLSWNQHQAIPSGAQAHLSSNPPSAGQSWAA